MKRVYLTINYQKIIENIDQISQIEILERFCEERAKKSIKYFFNNKGKISRIHLDVVAVLRSMDITCKYEYEIKDLNLVDIFIPSKNLIIEVNGPSHYIPGGYSLRGSTYVKSAVLSKLGFIVGNIHHQDWSELKGLEAKRQFIKNLIKEAEITHINL